MRQNIRGYTDAVIEAAGSSEELSQTASELAGIVELLGTSQDLRRVLTDPGAPVPARRAVVSDLLESRVGAPALRLVHYAIEADRAPEVQDDLIWLANRIDAAARHLEPVGHVILGRRAAIERVEGYATALLQDVKDKRTLGRIEDEMFRFMRIVSGSEELQGALTNRDVSAEARQALVVDLLKGRASPTTVRLAAYATQVGRSRDYQNLLTHLVDRVAAESDRRLAAVRSAIDLDDDRRRHLATVLSQVAGRTVDVRLTVDPSVLGGFVATIGDTVVDGSIRHRLDLLKERLTLPEAEITIGEPS